MARSLGHGDISGEGREVAESMDEGIEATDVQLSHTHWPLKMEQLSQEPPPQISGISSASH